MHPNDQWKNAVIDCMLSLVVAVDEAGGRMHQDMLDRPLRDFISSVAGPNGIRFTYVKPASEEIDKTDCCKGNY